MKEGNGAVRKMNGIQKQREGSGQVVADDEVRKRPHSGGVRMAAAVRRHEENGNGGLLRLGKCRLQAAGDPTANKCGLLSIRQMATAVC